MAIEDEIQAMIPVASDIITMMDTMTGLTSATTLRSGIQVMTGVGFPLAVAVLSLVQHLIPDRKHQAIMGKLDAIEDSIQSVRNDISALEDIVRWEGVRTRYFDSEMTIRHGISNVIALGNATGNGRQYQKQRFIDFCQNQDIELAVNTLIAGIRGDALFGSDILDAFYDHTGGHKRQITQFSARLIQMVFSGMVSQIECDMLIAELRGLNFTQVGYRTEQQLRQKVRSLQRHVIDVIRRCDDEMEENMQRDLETLIDDHHRESNSDIASHIYNKMSSKYNLWIQSLVYNDIHGFERHTFSGQYVTVLHVHRKCAIVFYRIGEPSNWISQRKANARDVINDVQSETKCVWASCRVRKYTEALETHNAIKRRIGSNNLWGLAVIKRHVNLWSSHNTGSQLVWMMDIYFTYVVLVK